MAATQLALNFARGSARGAGGFPAGSPMAAHAANMKSSPIQQSLDFGPPMSLGGRGFENTNPAVQARLASMMPARDAPVGGPLSSSWLPGNARPQPRPFERRHSTLAEKVQMMDTDSRLAGNGGIVSPGHNPGWQNPGERGWGSVADFYNARGTPAQRARFSEPPGATPVMVEEVKAVNSTKKVNPVSSEKAGTGAGAGGFTPTNMGEMGGRGVFGAAIGMGIIGGTFSHMTGGEFGQGFVAGAAGGFAARGLKRMSLNNMADGGGLKMTKKFAGSSFSEGPTAVLKGTLNSAARSAQTMNTSVAMMGGAALGGVMFGGNRNSHQRGFNQSRGNRF